MTQILVIGLIYLCLCLNLKLRNSMDEQLGKEYEDWLDGIEPTLPLPTPEDV